MLSSPSVKAGGADNSPPSATPPRQEPLWTYDFGFSHLHPVSISSNGEYIVAGSCNPAVSYGRAQRANRGVYLFSRDSNRPLWHYHYDYPIIYSVDISENGEYIAAGGPWGLYFFSHDNKDPLWIWEGDASYVSMSSDGKYIAASGDDGLHLFSYRSNTPLWSYNVWSYEVVISPDGEYIAACICPERDSVERINLFGREDNSPLWIYYPPVMFESLDISKEGVRTVIGDAEAIRVFLRIGTTFTQLWSYDDAEYAAISPDAKYVAASGYDVASDCDVISMFSYGKGGIPQWTSQVSPGIWSIDISPGGNYMAACGTDDKIFLFSRFDNFPLWSADVKYSEWFYWYREYLDISYDGSYIVVGSGDGKIQLFKKEMPTNLTLAPSVQTLQSDDSVTLTATLTSNGTPLEEKTIIWSATAGNITPELTVTDSQGQTTASYTAPSMGGNYRITATFGGDNRYETVSENSSCTVYFAVLTFHKPDGNPFANTEIYYGYSSDQVTNCLGTTDNEGKILVNENIGGQTIYFKTSDEKYAGSASIGSTGGEITAELTKVSEVSEFPILWIIAVVAIITAAIGALLLIKKRK